ncbi:hypothetical protein GCM10008959_33120 [Deinococcus seoulensis]|uniref:HipA-like kinase domain-containing protein n=1 Tax=Deinococcus seoulensis TaxID=1837379 RepID=A0ABQ2RUN0_9DEIO|nr:HipA family kinase [Deinococcus seoulensis]GGR68373.1 hypothetical protein GCM10008959_33120 [Deinococcus seoulensis]
MTGPGQRIPQAELYFGPVGRGNSQPQKFLLSDQLGLCAVKFQQNPQGPRMLVNEWIGHGLAAQLGIRHAAYGLVDVPADALPHDGCIRITDDDGDEVRLLPGLHFYSQWLEPADDLKPEDLTLGSMMADIGMLAGVAVLDAWLDQRDRKPLNPNILLVRRSGRSSLYLMDMGMAFRSAIWGLGDLLDPRLPDAAAPLPYSMSPADLFRAVRPADFAPYLDAVSGMTEAIVQSVIDGLPREWGVTVAEHTALVNYLLTRAQALPDYFEARFQRPGQEWWE